MGVMEEYFYKHVMLDMLVDKAVRNDLSLNTRVIHSVVPVNNLINDTIREG